MSWCLLVLFLEVDWSCCRRWLAKTFGWKIWSRAKASQNPQMSEKLKRPMAPGAWRLAFGRLTFFFLNPF